MIPGHTGADALRLVNDGGIENAKSLIYVEVVIFKKRRNVGHDGDHLVKN